MTACKFCGEPISDRRELTRSGFHPDCAAERQRRYLMSVSEHRGPGFDHWRRQTLRAFGGVPLDDLQRTA